MLVTMTSTSSTPPPPARGVSAAARGLAAYAEALAARDWAGVRAALSDRAQVTLLHTGEVLDAEAFTSFNRDYPGDWTFRAVEVVDGGERAVLRSVTEIDGQVWHCAGFARADDDGRLDEITEIWSEAVTTPPDRSHP
jgi:hypothetical protein